MNPRPHGSEKLSGKDRYRLREGRYRILYSIQHQDLSYMWQKLGIGKMFTAKLIFCLWTSFIP